MNLCGYGKISINLRTLSINHDYPKTRSLRLILSEFGIRVIGLEVLNLLEMRLLLYRTHGAELVSLWESLESSS